METFTRSNSLVDLHQGTQNNQVQGILHFISLYDIGIFFLRYPCINGLIIMLVDICVKGCMYGIVSYIGSGCVSPITINFSVYN